MSHSAVGGSNTRLRTTRRSMHACMRHSAVRETTLSDQRRRKVTGMSAGAVELSGAGHVVTGVACMCLSLNVTASADGHSVTQQ